jgi:subfamily B ATP-binding cassette protein MsbA
MQDFKRLLNYLKPHWFIIVVAIIAMLLTAFFQTATLALLTPLLDQFQPNSTVASKAVFNLHKLIPEKPWFDAWVMIAVLLLTFTIGKAFSAFISSYLMAKIGQYAVLEIRKELYSHLLNQSNAFFEKHRTNFLVSRLITSCGAIEFAVSANLRDVLRESFILIFFLSAAFWINWKMMLGAIVVGPIIAVLTSKFSRALRKLADVSLKGNQKLTDTAQESLSNQTIVKAYTAEERENKRFSAVAELIAAANLRSGKIAAISPGLIETIGMVVIVILFYFGLREINLGNMKPAEFFTFLFYLLTSYDPMRKISRQHNELSKAFAAAQDVWDILDESKQLPEKDNPIILEELRNKISIENVSFNYQEKDKKVLTNISIEIPKGQMIALVGESGGGKSSLIRLIQRLYDPTEGKIFWDGKDLRDIKLESLKKQIALVTQENVLFNDTLRYNISYGKPEATDEEIQRAAKIAYADQFIEDLPEKYETIVGERGTFLSGGQRQRVAIARAVLMDAPVLILDEATSALDTESEKFVKKALANLMQGKTSIVIAHRLSTVQKADKIVVLQRGQIIETGTHSELIKVNGVYKKLYELQFVEDSNTGFLPEN